MMTAEATRYNTSVENLREQGFFFDENAFGDCHWFASCGELGGTPMSLAWYSAQQAGVRARLHTMRDKNAVMRSKRTFNISGGRSITANKTTMLNKRTFIRRAYKAIQPLTSHKYYDNDWSAVEDVMDAIAAEGDVRMLLTKCDYQGQMGSAECRKVWRYDLTGCDRLIDLQIIASFCGTVADPMSAYDITVLMN